MIAELRWRHPHSRIAGQAIYFSSPTPFFQLAIALLCKAPAVHDGPQRQNDVCLPAHRYAYKDSSTFCPVHESLVGKNRV